MALPATSPLAYAFGLRLCAGTLLLVVEELPLAGESTVVGNAPPYITAAPGHLGHRSLRILNGPGLPKVSEFAMTVFPTGFCQAVDSPVNLLG
jgi:hypothetical protein